MTSPTRESKSASTLLLIGCGDLVNELQPASPPRGMIMAPRAVALEHSCRAVRCVCQRCPDSTIEVELPVAVGIRTSVFKKRTRRRIEHVRL